MTYVLSHPSQGLQVVGEADGDRVQGAASNDWLIGHAGADVFVFEKGAARDIVQGFERGVDVLEVHSSIRQTSMRDTEAGMEVWFGAFGQAGADHFLVAGVHQLSLADFAFV